MKALVLGAALVVAGAVLLGQGAYIQAKAALAQVLLEAAWSRTAAGADDARPWPWADTRPVARLRVPRLGLDQIVLADASGRTLAFGPAHVAGTAVPGEVGVSIVAGHRDTHFAALARIEPGDRILVDRPDGPPVAFRVTDTRVVHQDRARLMPSETVPMIVLTTCYPFEAVVPGGPLRYVVTAMATADS